MSDSRELTLTWSAPQPDVVCLLLRGDLDYDSSDALTEAVDTALHGASGVHELRLDCAEVSYCDSYGLSSLLLVRRRTAAAGVTLHLDHRGPALERLLRITNTLDHLTGPAGTTREERYDS